MLATVGGIAASHLLTACFPLSGSSSQPARANGSPAPSTTQDQRQREQSAELASTASSSPASLPSVLRAVPRDRTLIAFGVGGEAPVAFQDVAMQNPLLPGITRSGYQVVMEPLYYYNPYHTSSVCGPPNLTQCFQGEIPWLATYYVYDADYTNLTVYLREGVEWSDGEPFTASDVVFTVNLLRKNAPNLTWSVSMQHWVSDVVALDEHTVRFALSAPNPRFFFSFFMHHQDFGVPIVPEHVFRGQNPLTFSNFDLTRGWPVVTGPYRLVYSDPQRKVWDRRDDWWAAKTGFHPLPQPERLVFLPGDGEAARVDALAKNDVDTTLNLSVDNIRLAMTRNSKVATWTGFQSPYGYVDYWTTGLGFNDSKPPFDDSRVRWAINAIINRDELVARGYRGAGEAAVLPYPDFPSLAPYLAGVSDLLTRYPVAAFDPQRSAQIMQARGYVRDHNGFWTRSGARVPIRIVTFSVEAEITAILVEQLRKGGFDASFTMPRDYNTPIYTGQADAFVFGHQGSVRGPYSTMSLYHSRFAAPTGQRATQPYRWRNPDFDRIVDQMATVSDSDPRLMPLFRQAIEIWLRELPDIPLVQFYHRIPVNTTYWSNWPDATNPYVNTANWHRTFELAVLSLTPSAP